MKILVIGSGGREHALAHALAKSPQVESVEVCPGNGGTQWERAEGLAPCRSVTVPSEAIVIYARHFGLVVVGPEAPLSEGLADRLIDAGVAVFGPTRAAARIETSKRFAKELMVQVGVPTADFVVCESMEQADRKLERFGSSVVIKADGLAAGKGVGVFSDLASARAFLAEAMVEQKFGEAGHRVLLEERLEGPELSVLAFCDGRSSLLLPTARDHKRLEDRDRGPNTGGMGAFSPVPGIDPEFVESLKSSIFEPVLQGLADRGSPFMGLLYAGLMLTEDGPKVLEFNCRFGDPETQVLLPLFQGDLAGLMVSCFSGQLDPSLCSWSEQTCATVVMASNGYPGSYQKGFPISLPQDGLIYQAGTRRNEEGQLLTNGGRVLAAVGLGENLEAALDEAYETVAQIKFEGAVYRSDIGRITVS